MIRTILIAAAVLALAPRAEAATEVGTTARMTPVTAYGGTIAWSEFDVATDRYRLVVRRGGVARRAPVAGRGVPFDVDLGPGPDGRVTAVYSRCRREPRVGELRHVHATGGGCDVYRHVLGSRTESRVRLAARRDRSEVLPSVWKGSLVFAARAPGSGFDTIARPYAIVDGKLRRLPGGNETVPGTRRRALGPGVTGLDVRGNAVAMTWTVDQLRCTARDEFDDRWGFEDASEAHLLDMTGSGGRIDRVCPGTHLFSPMATADGMRYAIRGGEPGLALRGFVRRTGARSQSRAGLTNTFSFAPWSADEYVVARAVSAPGAREPGAALSVERIPLEPLPSG